jgi:coenzyme F420-0:L-glutamate ligase / coenzyme F420-1:gamma-L-glutamate ligase
VNQAILTAVPRFPEVGPGTDLPALIVRTLRAAGLAPVSGDALVVAQKVVSKAEGSVVDLNAVRPGPEALRIAETIEKDPRLVEVVLRESTRVVRAQRGVFITEHRLGFICANAGVDHSNVGLGPDVVSLLPRDPDASARAIREALRAAFDVSVAVLINDSHGRPHREGAVGVCIGAAGFEPVVSLVGRPDLYGYAMRTSTEAIADEVAAAATLLQGQCAEGTPVVLVHGLALAEPATAAEETGAAPLRRDPARDLFR